MSCVWKPFAHSLAPARDRRGTVPLPASGAIADMRTADGWRAITSGEAKLQLSACEGSEPGRAGLRLDYDFQGSGGFVVARQEVRLNFPETYSLRFAYRGQGAINDLELKWVDAAGSSVWRHVMQPAAWTEPWVAKELRDRDFPFAWGPAGGGKVTEVGAIELVVVAREGGCGTLWLSQLELVDRTVYEAPQFSASSHRQGHPPSAAGDPQSATFWESAPEDPAPVWTADWRGEREFGGIAVRWQREAVPFTVEGSCDGVAWSELARGEATAGSSTFLASKGASARFLRLRFDPPRGKPVAVGSVELLPPEFAESRDAACHLVAGMAPRGWFPRYWLREQSYWTPAGPPEGAPRALMNEEGLIEPGCGKFSLEAFLWQGSDLITWADATIRNGLIDGWMPVPFCVWETNEWRLKIELGAAYGTCVVRYDVENRGPEQTAARLLVAIRPFQVTPPWQAYRGVGGAGRLEGLRREAPDCVVTGEGIEICAHPEFSAFGAMTANQGEILELLASGGIPADGGATDGAGLVSGVCVWDLDVAPGRTRTVEVNVNAPGCKRRPSLAAIESCEQAWRSNSLASPAWEIQGGSAEAHELIRAMRGAAAHILVNRDGAALQPGPRRYQRCWIRDAAGMGRALLYAGCRNEVRDLLTWYAPHIRDDGAVPCCVDREGPDWLPEHDSQGQYVHLLAEYLRFGGDKTVVAGLWPIALRTMARLQAMRESRMTEPFRLGNPPHRYGLLPESASHEGYLAHPVHAYWDDFWALRGLRDAVWLAWELGDKSAVETLSALRDSFAETLAESLEGLIAARALDFVPGSVEWADFDPSATANGLAMLDELPGVMPGVVEQTFARYLEGFRQRRDGEVPWENYTPYEIRVAGALLRLGWREETWELFRRFLADRRPVAWNQWPEIAWRNVRAPGHLGDVPHTWIGAEFVVAARSLFAYERGTDDSLVLAAGLPSEWLRSPEGLAIRNWPTAHGTLSCSLRLGERDARFVLEPGLRVPAGGIVLDPPWPGAVTECLVNGKIQPISESGAVRIRECPAAVEIRCNA